MAKHLILEKKSGHQALEQQPLKSLKNFDFLNLKLIKIVTQIKGCSLCCLL